MLIETESPKAQEVKYLYQNIKLIPDENGVLIKNQNLFVNTDKYTLKYTIKKEDELLEDGEINVSVDPGTEKYINLPIKRL